MPLNIEIDVQDCETLTLEIIDAPTGGGGDVSISNAADNRLERKPDGLYVPPSVADWGTTDW